MARKIVNHTQDTHRSTIEEWHSHLTRFKSIFHIVVQLKQDQWQTILYNDVERGVQTPKISLLQGWPPYFQNQQAKICLAILSSAYEFIIMLCCFCLSFFPSGVRTSVQLAQLTKSFAVAQKYLFQNYKLNIVELIHCVVAARDLLFKFYNVI